MVWVVDTCVLLDVLDGIAPFDIESADVLDSLSASGTLTIAPVSYVELAPAFLGNREMQDLFLRKIGVEFDFCGDEAAVVTAYKAWNDHVLRKRAGSAKKRPIADVMIGAYAVAKGGLVTRNEDDFRRLFHNLGIINPSNFQQ